MTPFVWVVLFVGGLVVAWVGLAWADRRRDIEEAKRRHPSGKDLP